VAELVDAFSGKGVRISLKLAFLHTGSIPVLTTKHYWKVGEWLKPTDCKSVLARVRGFESLPSNLKIMKKTFNNGILIGSIVTGVIYSIIMFIIIQNLMK
jgi:uncharacterized protein (DUF2062 family)